MPSSNHINRMVTYLSKLQSPTGGFGGGPQQLAHLAPTYAATCALMICGTQQAYDVIDRESMYKFLLSRKCPDGSFTMHENGEVDIRGVYCALAVASLLNILTPELTEGVPEWLARCQTYEGGFGGDVGLEAHGGYTYCGLAAIVILDSVHLIDKDLLVYWLQDRQMRLEGGFQGRPNKLVDGCYSFWQGASFPLVDEYIINPEQYNPDDDSDAISFGENEGGWCFNQLALQEYLYICCEDDHGGLRDKPGVRRDFYHTCYTLSGLSIAQHNPHYHPESKTIYGRAENLLVPNDPIYNITPRNVAKAKAYFSAKPKIQ
eukprot:TRINITY_DN6472_c3_g3_i2.p1 TRINITY_DN6472_c3_g3~~TRINITY_DN6472_c3_g3_i2.p1  ORF type:complete len:318 (+),score=73.63 TRINITY_DN6472_c3_g3_i2:503-1456(+)